MRDILKSISKQEKVLLLGLFIFFILLNCGQYLFTALITPADRVNLGFTAINGADASVYYSYIEQIRQGHFLTKDVFTSEPQARVTFSWLFCLLGLVAKITTLSAPTVLRLAQLCLIGPCLLILYWLIAYFLPEKKQRLSALVLLLSSGLGLLIRDFLQYLPSHPQVYGYLHVPMDLWVPELTAFGVLISFPHFVVSLSLLALSLLLLLLAWDRGSWGYAAAAGLSAAFLLQFHPYHFPLIWGLPFIYLAVLTIKNKKIAYRQWGQYSLMWLLTVPVFIYYEWLTNFDLVNRIKLIQNICLTTTWWLTIVAYGLPLVFAIIGVVWLIKNKQLAEKKLFLLIWLLFGWFLLYAPLPIQRRLSEGYQLVLIILAAPVLLKFCETILKIKSRFYSQSLIYALALMLFASNFVIYVVGFGILGGLKILQPAAEEYGGFLWLRNHDQEQTVFTSVYTGNSLAAATGQTVYFGHVHETVFSKSGKEELAAKFFNQETSPDVKLSLLKQKADYLFWGPLEQEPWRWNGQAPHAALSELMELENKSATVYRGSVTKIYQLTP